METIHGYTLCDPWKMANRGYTAKARKNGKTYFLKRYQITAPLDNGTLDAATFRQNKRVFDAFVFERREINARLLRRSGAGGNIVIPHESFMEGAFYVEATEFIEHTVPVEEQHAFMRLLGEDEKRLLMKTAVGALMLVHEQRIVHSDIKPENIVIVCNDAGNYIAKLIDFDSSYVVTNKPDELIGTVNYYSPEHAVCAQIEDPAKRQEFEKHLSFPTDIFSLGLVFHKWLCGDFPKVGGIVPEKLKRKLDRGRPVHTFEMVMAGCVPTIHASIRPQALRQLLSDMLLADPSKRPTAKQVLERLSSISFADGVIYQTPWPEHGLMWDRRSFKRRSMTCVTKDYVGNQKVYNVRYAHGAVETVTAEQMALVAKRAAYAYAQPWGGHGIEWNKSLLTQRGIVKIVLDTSVLSQGYALVRPNGMSAVFSRQELLDLGYARPCPEKATRKTVHMDPPWPEHRVIFDEEALIANEYTSLKRSEKGGVRGYVLMRTDGVERFMLVETLCSIKMAFGT